MDFVLELQLCVCKICAFSPPPPPLKIRVKKNSETTAL